MITNPNRSNATRARKLAQWGQIGRRFVTSPAGALVTASAVPKIQRMLSRLLALSSNSAVVNSPQPVAQVPQKASQKRKNSCKVLSPEEVTKKICMLEEQNQVSLSEKTARTLAAGRVVANLNAVGYNNYMFADLTAVDTALGGLQFFDPSTPGTLITADGSSGTYAREYSMKFYTRFEVRNNYQVPCDIVVYAVEPKADTSITPTTAITNGLTDVGNPSSTSPGVFPSDSPQFKELWAIKATKRCRLEPGEGFEMTHGRGFFKYDPSEADSHAQAYQTRNFKSYGFLVRVVGVVGHDSAVTTEFTTLAAGVDYKSLTTCVVRYNNGGPSLKWVTVSNGMSSAVTNGLVLSEKPIADNIAYSIS